MRTSLWGCCFRAICFELCVVLLVLLLTCIIVTASNNNILIINISIIVIILFWFVVIIVTINLDMLIIVKVRGVGFTIPVGTVIIITVI